MTFKEFQAGVLRTWNHKKPLDQQIQNAALGIAGEGGEVAELVKKGIHHGHGIERRDVKNELGDALYYIAAMAHLFDIDLEDVAIYNATKLQKRYPDGFSEADSRARRDVGETAS